jgi:Cu/Ag efflux protein CusF
MIPQSFPPSAPVRTAARFIRAQSPRGLGCRPREGRAHARHTVAVWHRPRHTEARGPIRQAPSCQLFLAISQDTSPGLVFAPLPVVAAERVAARHAAEAFNHLSGSCPMNKPIALASILLLTASLAYAAPAKSATPKAKTHVVATEVVSADVAGNKLTVKGPNNTEMTMPCQGKAVSELKSVKAGEKVDVVCQDNAKGEHVAIVGIKPASATKAKK